MTRDPVSRLVWPAMALLLGAEAFGAVGRTVGSFEVSPTGAATYSIPIFTPPGPRGTQPNISIKYHSDASSGPLGRGWFIAGLASINRCAKTVAQDSSAEPVALQASDGYCLNGNRLRLTSGSYGSAGSTYQTELADFSHITAVGAQGNGPASFVALGKDGLTYEYGTDGNSRVLATGTATASVWMLRKITDRSGNRVLVTYVAPDLTTTGATNPALIEWAATSAGAATFLYSMSFSYTDNTAAGSFAGFQSGTEVRNSDLLTSISVTSSGNVVRKYFLSYNTSPTTGVYRLSNVLECADAGGSDCLSPTIINYQDGAASYSASVTNGPSGISSSLIANKYDFNGDGIRDLIYVSGSTWHVALASTTGYGSPINTGLSAFGGQLYGDFLGNGRDGLLRRNGTAWQHYTWTGTGFAAAASGLAAGANSASAVVADVNGDGRADLATVVPGSPDHQLHYWLNTSSSGTASFATEITTPFAADPGSFDQMLSTDGQRSPIKSFDFNGDGRRELLYKSSELYDCDEFFCASVNIRHVAVSLSGAGVATPYEIEVISGSNGIIAPAPQYLNWNDDACTDFVSGFGIEISDCNGATATTIAPAPGATVHGVIDFDSDGRNDLLVSAGGQLGFQRSTGTGILATVSSAIPDLGCSWITVDANGDGLDEIGCLTSGGAFSYRVHALAGVAPDLATSFTDGFGVNQSVTYAHATAGVHTKQTDSVYPNADINPQKYLVLTVSATDGAGGTYTQSFAYWGAATNLQGRGFAGFASRREIDSRDNIQRFQFYRRDFPYTGALTKLESYQPGGSQLIARINTAFTHQVLDSTANNQRLFVHPSGGDTVRHEVGGTANGALITQSSQTLTFDAWGNLTAATRTVTDKDLSSPHYNQSWTEVTSASITPDTSINWCLGLPTSVTVTRSASNGEAGVTRTRSYSNNAAFCRPTQEVVEPSSSNRRVATTFGYDSFGNPNSIAVVGRNSNGSDMTARTITLSWGTTGQFPTVETNPLNQSVQRTYHPTFGSLATETDANGIVVVSNQFDTFGRLIRQTNADSTSTVYTYAACATYGCQNGDPNSALTSVNKMTVSASERTTGDVQVSERRVYLDQFDRPIVELSQNMAGGFDRVGWQFDARGYLHRSTAPCAAASCSVYWITNSYDLVGRVTLQSRPQSQSVPTLVTTTFGYAGRTQTHTDPQSKVRTEVSDVNGWLRRTQDHSGYYQSLGYDAAGSLKQVTDSTGNTLFTANYSYSTAAIVDSSFEMNSGAWTYTHNSLGERTSWTDAKAQSFSTTYDALSRPLVRTEPSQSTTWNWGTSAANKNIGRLASLSSTTPAYSETYAYDSIGRLSGKTINLSSVNYTYNYAYTNEGRLDTVTFPTSTSSTRVRLKHTYQHGILKSITDFTTGSAGTVYWQVTAQNPRGETTTDQLGTGLIRTRAFDAVTGWQDFVQAGVGGGASTLNQAYLYDFVGNVIQRQDNNAALTENFFYDNLYRLTNSSLNGATNLTVTYDAMGNITSRSDVAGGATWTYDTVKRHAVRTAGAGNTYNYDANGNMTSRNGSTITWTSYNYPTQMAVPGGTATISYGPDRQYVQTTMPHPAGGNTETIRYVGEALERRTRGTLHDWRHYVYAEGTAVAIVSRRSDGVNAVRYLLQDHQESTAVIANNTGGTVLKESFAAFGAQRNGNTWSGAVSTADQTTMVDISRHGYTSHTMLGFGGLIHMNGRVADSITGRFLSPDPFVPRPWLTQSYNRYAYVRNNPLSYSDPSGFNEFQSGEPGNAGGVIETVWVFGQRLAQSTFPSGFLMSTWGVPGPSTNGPRRGVGPASENGFFLEDPTDEPESEFGAHEAAELLWPGYDLGTCMSSRGDCNGGEWAVGVVGVIPGGKGAALGAKGLIRGIVGARAVKAINLPAWKKVGIDMRHVLERHTAEGALAVAGRTTFPELMNAKGIERAIREAYRYGEKIGSQGDRVLMQGTSGGMTIEMWVNRATGMIETAYPVMR